MIDWTYKAIRRLVILVIGGTLLLIGVALLFLPGPGTLFIFGSIAVLAIEFVWARRLLKRLRDMVPGGGKPDDPLPPGRLRRVFARAGQRLTGRRRAAARPGSADDGAKDSSAA